MSDIINQPNTRTQSEGEGEEKSRCTLLSHIPLWIPYLRVDHLSSKLFIFHSQCILISHLLNSIFLYLKIRIRSGDCKCIETCE